MGTVIKDPSKLSDEQLRAVLLAEATCGTTSVNQKIATELSKYYDLLDRTQLLEKLTEFAGDEPRTTDDVFQTIDAQAEKRREVQAEHDLRQSKIKHKTATHAIEVKCVVKESITQEVCNVLLSHTWCRDAIEIAPYVIGVTTYDGKKHRKLIAHVINMASLQRHETDRNWEVLYG